MSETMAAQAATEPVTAPSAALTDDERLAQLGYGSRFERKMSLWENFSLGFTYLSPVVGVYTLFAFALATGGPPMIWSFLIVGVGQLLVSLVFAEVVSQFPIAGGVYPWARRLWGKRWAWMTGWVYMFALLATIGGVTYGAGPFAAIIFDTTPTTGWTIGCALVIIALATIINLSGTRVLARAAFLGFAAELAGALVVGIWLLLFHREQSLSVLFHNFGTDSGHASYLGAFLAAGLIGLYQYYGFEACGDVAEEVPNPGRRIPKAMRMTIYIGGAAATFVCLALLLATPNIGAVISGKDADPIGTVLADAFGTVGSKIVIGVVLISFVSCAMSLQAAASRLIWSYARDHMIFASKSLGQFSERLHVPPVSLGVAAVVPAAIVLTSTVSTDALTKIISFASLGIYVAFQMVVFAALVARLRGWWPSGEYRLGRWGLPVNVVALGYGIAAMLNLAWPRTPDVPWYDNWIVALGAAVVIGVGLIYMLAAAPWNRGTAPAGDAAPKAVLAAD